MRGILNRRAQAARPPGAVPRGYPSVPRRPLDQRSARGSGSMVPWSSLGLTPCRRA